jgi:hypothetical protein
MQLMSWVGLALGVVLVTASRMGGPPPVILDLGPVVPTPAPSPHMGERKRLITTITVQNSAAGETVVSFEATDVADKGGGKIRSVASKQYSLAEEKPELKELKGKILRQIRDLERDLLAYAERAGPPKERAPLGTSETGGGPGQSR